jgi:tetratricopeptide (TPR) repeat protein
MQGKVSGTRKTHPKNRRSTDGAIAGPHRRVEISKHRNWWSHIWKTTILWAFVFAAYSNSFSAALLYDNDLAILQDTRVHTVTLHNLNRIVTEGYWASEPTADLYRPLTTLSYLLNYAVLGNGPAPAGYHWLNLGLHAANVSLVYVLGSVIFSQPALGFATAAIWGLHPLLTEGVTNVVGRADLLAALGVLSGLLSHIQASGSVRGRKLGWLMALTASQTLGIFSKESAVILPGIMLLYDLTWSERAVWRMRIFSYAALVLPFTAFFALRNELHTHLYVLFNTNPLVSVGFWTARLTAVKVIGKFLWLFVWPAKLSADYSYNAIPLFHWPVAGWEDAEALITLVLCVGAMGLALGVWRKQKPLFFFLSFFFIALVPTSNLIIVIGSIMAERFMYLPSVGAVGCTVWIMYLLLQRLPRQHALARRAGWIVAGLICLVFGVRTYTRNFDWNDDLSLWTSATKVNPDDALAHVNLGNALLKIPERLPEAILHYQRALQIYPGYASAHNNLGDALVQLPGRIPDAITEFEAALRIDPNYAEAHKNLGSALSRIPNRLPEAVVEFEAAVRIKPDDAQAHSYLGNALLQMPGRITEAVAQFESALRIDPDLVDAHYGLANALAQTPGRSQDALAQFYIVLMVTPDDAGAHANLGRLLAQMPGRMPEAITEWKTAVRLDPRLAGAHYQLGIALSRIPGGMPEAIQELEAAVRIRPDPRLQDLLNRLRGTQK